MRKSAYEGVRALADLNAEGSIDVYAAAVVQKDAQGLGGHQEGRQ